jgi:aspartate aminotransferase
LSKWCGAGGWRLGAFAFPIELEAVRKALAVMASETFSAVSSPIQYASIGAFQNNPEINDYLLGARKILRALLNFSYQQLRQAGAELASPDGGFYLFPRVAKITADKNITSSEQLCSAILTDTGVAVLPGSAFGRPVTELSMRIACVDFDGKKALLAASERGALDEGFIEQYCSNTVIGISRLCQWLNSHVEKQ